MRAPTTRPDSHAPGTAPGPDRGLGIGQGIARQFDYWRTVALRTWRGTLAGYFLSPLLYLLAMGVLLGGYVTASSQTLEGASSYLAFLVPGLVAVHAMQVGVEESTWPVMGALKWQKVYYAQLATPLGVRDVLNGHLAFMAFRIASATGVFLVVVAPFGVYASWWGPLVAFPVLVLLGMCFACLVYSVTVRLKNDEGIAVIFRLGVVPLSLFSGAFFPIANLGAVLEWTARLTPLWHGVNVTRMLTLDTWTATGWLNLLVLAILAVLGYWASLRGLRRRVVI